MKTVYKQERWGMVALILTNAGVSAAIIYLFINHQERLAIICLIILLYCVVLLVNFFKTKITLDELTVNYQTLFQNKTMRFDDIRKIESTANVTGASAHGFHAKYLTILYSDSDKIAIGIKTFSKRNLVEFANTLALKCQKAVIDKSTRFMMEGKMPSAFIKYK